ncbi:unnamed protein product [Lactuca virosa]|uniref:Uncharacterized protein n=1 Tax=Lactuca virosa TaxID=75947 RepID=A0AAU9P864_9ASTR|nr:unnamed protein product [Lactuca virosa]
MLEARVISKFSGMINDSESRILDKVDYTDQTNELRVKSQRSDFMDSSYGLRRTASCEQQQQWHERRRSDGGSPVSTAKEAAAEKREKEKGGDFRWSMSLAIDDGVPASARQQRRWLILDLDKVAGERDEEERRFWWSLSSVVSSPRGPRCLTATL